MIESRATHLILVGLPGAGKSTVASLLADRLAIPYVDLDAEIERDAGHSVAQLFALDGEAMFRRREYKATERLRVAPSSVVAPGGGWITQPEVVALLCPPGRIIHLHVTPVTALGRMGNEVGRRPLLVAADPLAALESIAAHRAAAYRTADVVLDTETLSLQELVARAAALASSWGVGVG